MIFRAARDFEFHDQRGNPVDVNKGELVDVLNRHEANDLLRQGKILRVDRGATGKTVSTHGGLSETFRVALWLKTSNHYSGGRVHLYQYAVNLARAGAEVFYISNRLPAWSGDYPNRDDITFLINDDRNPPDDLDVIMTDSKGSCVWHILEYCRDHPHTKLVCLNFETPNWQREFTPKYGDSLPADMMKAGYEQADLLLANSSQSLEYLLDWVDFDPPRTGVLNPAINTFACEERANIQLPKRPYAMWSARSVWYKGKSEAKRAVENLDMPFDLCLLGGDQESDDLDGPHALHSYPNLDDAGKFALLHNAAVTLAPSRFEGFGMVPGESLSVGTPVVCYDLPVLRDVYGDCLHYVPLGDEDAYIETVAEVIKSNSTAGDDFEDEVDISRAQVFVREAYGMNAQAETIDNLPFHAMDRQRIDACMICYGTPTARYAVESVYDIVDSVRIAYGPTEHYQRCTPGLSYCQDVLDDLRAMPDPDDKIEIEARGGWRDKKQMRSYLSDRIEGNFQLILDADEIWVGLEEWLEHDICYWATPRWVTFWHDIEHWIHDEPPYDRRFGESLGQGSVCPHYRFSWWRPSFRWRSHPVTESYDEIPLFSLDGNKEASELVPECRIYHLGHALPKDYMNRKHSFYERRDGAPGHRRRAWHEWSGETGKCEDGIVERVDWQIPEIVKRAYNAVAEADTVRG